MFDKIEVEAKIVYNASAKSGYDETEGDLLPLMAKTLYYVKNHRETIENLSEVSRLLANGTHVRQ